MGKSLGLVSCTKSKRSHRCPAREMYQASELFRKAYKYAIKHYDYVAILSAKYGLLLPEEEIDPYQLTLKSMTTEEQRNWSEKVLSQLEGKLDALGISEVFFHAGFEYRRHLVEQLGERGIRCHVPLKGLGIGQQKAWYLDHA